jgi:hypothetical protein
MRPNPRLDLGCLPFWNDAGCVGTASDETQGLGLDGVSNGFGLREYS